MPFDQFAGYIPNPGYDPNTDPSIYDVQRRQKLADLLAQNNAYVPNSGPLGALAQALAGTASAYEGKQASTEAQTGLDQSNKALAAALAGGDLDPSALIQAGGSSFLPDSESGLVGDLIKRKMGIGETYYGTPQVSYDDQGNPHYSIIGSLGDVKEIRPPGGAGSAFSIKNQLVDTPTAAGVPVNPYSGSAIGSGVAKNNAQAESDKSYGGILGANAGNGPQQLQVEGQLLQTLDNQHQLVDKKVDTALQQIDGGVLNTGTVGSLLSALPGTPQYDLAQNLQTIKANVGFDTLQNMRQNSPTGGALGQISNMEEQLLQAVNGSLEQGQTKDQLKSNLVSIKTLLAQVNALKHQSFESDKLRLGSAPAAPPVIGAPAPLTPPAAPASGVVDYSTYFGGQ